MTPILPLFHRKDRETLRKVARLWTTVLLANMAGALVIAWTLGNTGTFPPEVRAAFGQTGLESIRSDSG